MSLETGSFIKDLVATNPQGTDPKSQGDDHLRLIKSVLKSQFSGFTAGVPITLTETELNAVLKGGFQNAYLATDLNAVPTGTRFNGVGGATAGTKPSGGATGDLVFTHAFDNTKAVQIYWGMATKCTFTRFYDGVWAGWTMYTGDSGLLDFAFGAGWSAAQQAGYRRYNGVVYLSGTVNNGAEITVPDLIATLPLGYRPANTQSLSALVMYSNNAAQVARMSVRTSGEIELTAVRTISGTASGACTLGMTTSFIVQPA